MTLDPVFSSNTPGMVTGKNRASGSQSAMPVESFVDHSTNTKVYAKADSVRGVHVVNVDDEVCSNASARTPLLGNTSRISSPLVFYGNYFSTDPSENVFVIQVDNTPRGEVTNPVPNIPMRDLSAARFTRVNTELHFQTAQNINVHVLYDDFINPQSIKTAHVIVSPCDESLSFSGGLSQQIIRAADRDIERECRRHVEDYRGLPVTGWFCSGPGSLSSSYINLRNILHVVGPPPRDRPSMSAPRATLEAYERKIVRQTSETYFHCLCYTNSALKLPSMAFPPLGAGKLYFYCVY